MPDRYLPLPRLWLMTDERIADAPSAVARLPRGAGVVFRHHATEAKQRRTLFSQIKRICRARRLMLILADTPAKARAWGADGAHHRSALKSLNLRTVAVHDRRELQVARQTGADLVFVSPVFATRSHPGAETLGAVRLGLLSGVWRDRTIALGGMNPKNFRRLRSLGLRGWAAIDALG